ncbi:hypothetical protein OU524_27425, partial [Escherichia coli]|nr:hypothetical protein [Escherichia coli]
LPSETMIWQPEFTDKTLSRKPGAVQCEFGECEITVQFRTTLHNQYPGFYSGKQDCGYPVSRLCVTNGVGAKHRIKCRLAIPLNALRRADSLD